MKNDLSIISGMLFFIGLLWYAWTVFRDRKKPETDITAARPTKISWIIWGSLDVLTFAGMYYAHSLNGQMKGTILGMTIVLPLVLLYGKKGWGLFDFICLFGAGLGIYLWQKSNNPVLALIASNATALIGSLPTFWHTWKTPGAEDKLAWTLFWVSCVCAIIAIPNDIHHWLLADALQPVTFGIIETIVMLILIIRSPLRSWSPWSRNRP